MIWCGRDRNAEAQRTQSSCPRTSSASPRFKTSPTGQLFTNTQIPACIWFPTTMAQWAGKLDAFLTFNDRSVLNNAGKVDKKVADALAIKQYERDKAPQRRIEATEPTSNFDRFVDDIRKLNPFDETEDDNG